MTNLVLFLAVLAGAAVGVIGWLGAMYFYRNRDHSLDERTVLNRVESITRLKLVLVAVLGVVVLSLAVVINDVSNKLSRVEDVQHNQECIIGLLRTEQSWRVLDGELHARGCPVVPPFQTP